MRKKQAHCMPTCAIPSNPAVQASGLITLQQSISCRLVGKTRIFAIAHVPDVVPRRM